ncbi:MAG: T9SS type A sorting domain-containing protein [Saprospiraceae bacterium]
MRLVEILIFFFCSSYISFLNAQERVFSIDLPEVGDVHYYKLDNLPDDINLDFQGNRRAWNLSMLSAPTAHKYLFSSVTTSDYSIFFPQADMMSYDLWKNEKYYKKIGDGLFELGEVINPTLGSANLLIKKYTDPRPIYVMNYTMNVPIKYEAKWEVVLNGKELSELSGISTSLFKIEGVEQIEETIEDFGILFLPRKRFNSVIKLERIIASDIRLYMSTGKDAWEEIDFPQGMEQFPLDLALRRKEVIFLAEESSEWLAFIELDKDDQIKNALFKSSPEQIKRSGGYGESNFFLYPNPTFGIVRLDFVNLPKDIYDLEVYNIIGKKIWAEEYAINGYTTIKVDLSFLSKGTYLYSLTDKSGKKLFTRKMAIVNP